MEKFSKFKSMVGQYRWKSLFFVYFKKFFIILFIPVIILNSLIFYLYARSERPAVQNSIKDNYNSNYQAIDKVLSDMFNIINTLSINTSVCSFLAIPDIEHPDYEQIRNSIQTLISNMATAANLKTVSIYSKACNYVLSSGSSNYYDFYLKKDLIERFVKDANQSCIYTAEDSSFNFGFVSYYQKEVNAVYLIEIEAQELLGNSSSQKDQVFTLSNQNQIIFSSKKSIEYLENLKERTVDFNSQNYFFSAFYPESIAVKNDLSNWNLSLTIDFPLKEKTKSIYTLLWLIALFIILLSVVLSLILAFYFSMQNYKSISSIAIQFQNDFNDEDSGHASDELEFIINNILNMNKKVMNFESQLTSQMLQLKKSRTLILQSQINPHFIMNTLNSINLDIISQLGEDCAAVSMLSSLSYMLRDLLSSDKYLTYIQKEVLYTQRYIELETIRYQNSFDVIWEIDENLLHCICIKMFLQPIVENAITHGLHPLQSRRGNLKINIAAKNSSIIYTISDNGVGFEKSKLKKMQYDLTHPSIPSQKHIGLINVNTRIKTIWGENYGIKVHSDSSGTSVTLCTPKLSYDSISGDLD